MGEIHLQDMVRQAAPAVVALCTAAALLAVAANFLFAPPSSSIQTEKKSVVATGTMLVYFMVLYLLLRFHVGAVLLPERIANVLLDLGLALILVGTVVNVMGRVALGGQWGNHVVLYKEHAMVSTGMFRWVRHPLYASLIWMACGASLIFSNIAALAATLCVFLPAMIYRARQEEVALITLFPGYAEYRRKTGMLVPWPWPHK